MAAVISERMTFSFLEMEECQPAAGLHDLRHRRRRPSYTPLSFAPIITSHRRASTDAQPSREPAAWLSTAACTPRSLRTRSQVSSGDLGQGIWHNAAADPSPRWMHDRRLAHYGGRSRALYDGPRDSGRRQPVSKSSS